MEHTSLQPKTLAQTLFERFFDDWRNLSVSEFLSYLKPKIDQSITFQELEKRLNTGKPLSIKFGIDPTGSDVHLGHLLPIIVLKQFQKAGHVINLIIGDFTARIGDPSGRNTQRPPLTNRQIKQNSSTYFKQINPFLDTRKVRKHHNSSWLAKRKFADILSDLSKVNLSQVLQRQDFRARLDKGHGLSVGELLYSYAQAIDSVKIKPDVEVGGRDQLLNFAQARDIMEFYDCKPEVGLVTPVLEGTAGDGKKMSKSENNYIAASASEEDTFGKLMSIPDELISSYLIAFADIKEGEQEQVAQMIKDDPMEIKKQLAQFFVAVKTHDIKSGEKERERFENKFKKGTYDDTVPTLKGTPETTYFDLLNSSGVFESKSELKRIFQQKGVHCVEPTRKTVTEDDTIQEGVIRVGKTKFFRIVI